VKGREKGGGRRYRFRESGWEKRRKIRSVSLTGGRGGGKNSISGIRYLPSHYHQKKRHEAPFDQIKSRASGTKGGREKKTD